MPDQPAKSNEAADLYASALRRAAAQQLNITELIGCAEQLKLLDEPGKVIELYKAWIAYNPDNPFLYAVYFNYAVTLSNAADMTGSMNALRAAIKAKPDFYPPYINLGNLWEGQGNLERAYAEWIALVNALPDVNADTVTHKILALKQLGRILESREQDTLAEGLLKQALDLNAEQLDVMQHWISLRMRQCKWPVMAEWGAVKKTKMMAGISPLSIAAFTDDPILQLGAALQYNKRSVGLPATPRPKSYDVKPGDRKPGPLRIGYVSSDLREHAVGFAMTEVVELHDSQNFEIFAYYCGISRDDAIKARIKAGAGHWFEINGLSDQQAADRIKDDGIDILVDLNGYTKDARTKVFALRPAPINVNWFGFPSTMGSPYHHYIVADSHIIPPSHDLYYSERVVRLPCYQPNDRKRSVSPKRPTRQEVGLPEDAFVYCCLNGSQKFTAITFQRWMLILQNVPGSVLWLLTATPETNELLRQRAQENGIDPRRLVFAEKRANPDHLARYPLADLFLDNFPYGAHTTAADAIWMGVPILTLPGRSFASRVCSSLAHAAGIGDMVCATPDDYVLRAVAFGRDPSQLAPIKQRLAAGRDTCLLFDTPKLVRGLEEAYQRMWAEFARGDLPKPDLGNLDIYHEVGAELEAETLELLSDEAYHALYREKLAARDDFFPIRPDNRLWRREA